MAKFRLTCTGVEPLLMHNARLSDPLDDVSLRIKKVSAKRKKTEDDHHEMGRLEHWGSLYIDAKFGPFIPGQNFERMLVDAAKKIKLGTQVKLAVIVETNVNPLIYHGPRTVEGLWEDKNYVHRASAKVGTSRIQRTRPIFQQWEVTADGFIDTEQINPAEFDQIVDIAGRLIGLGDWRPRFGRFRGSVEMIDGA
jgi:hypothetical protein